MHTAAYCIVFCIYSAAVTAEVSSGNSHKKLNSIYRQPSTADADDSVVSIHEAAEKGLHKDIARSVFWELT